MREELYSTHYPKFLVHGPLSRHKTFHAKRDFRDDVTFTLLMCVELRKLRPSELWEQNQNWILSLPHQVFSPADQMGTAVARPFSQQWPDTLEFTGLCSRTQPWKVYLPRNPKVIEQTLGWGRGNPMTVSWHDNPLGVARSWGCCNSRTVASHWHPGSTQGLVVLLVSYYF